MKRIVMILGAVAMLSGCVVSPRPIDPYTRAAIIGASEQQALQNAHDAVWKRDNRRSHSHRVYQHAQAAKKPISKSLNGYTFKRGSDGIAYIDGKPAAIIENNIDATVYQVGMTSCIVYKSGRVALIVSGDIIGYMK